MNLATFLFQSFLNTLGFDIVQPFLKSLITAGDLSLPGLHCMLNNFELEVSWLVWGEVLSDGIDEWTVLSPFQD